MEDAEDAGSGREVWRLLPEGRRQPLLAGAFAVTDEHGGVEVVHSVSDVTRLKEADEAKTLFLATASHELKTPVTVIAGFAETILRYPDMPTDRRPRPSRPSADGRWSCPRSSTGCCSPGHPQGVVAGM